MKSVIVLLSVLSTLSACSSVPVTSSTVQMIPPERIYQSKYFTKTSDDQVKVEISRDRGAIGSACSHTIYANDEKLFAIRTNEMATVYLDPKFYIFRLETGAGWCPNITITQESTLQPNSEAKYRITMPSDVNLRMIRVK